MATVLRWPTMLYVSAEVAPMSRKVERETSSPQVALKKMMAYAWGEP